MYHVTTWGTTHAPHGAHPREAALLAHLVHHGVEATASLAGHRTPRTTGTASTRPVATLHGAHASGGPWVALAVHGLGLHPHRGLWAREVVGGMRLPLLPLALTL